MMNSKATRRQVVAGLGAALAMPMLGGRAGAQGNPIEITYWGWQGGTDMSEKVVGLFHEKFPNIRVNYVNSADEHYLKLRNALAAGTGAPDAADMEYHMVPDFALRGALADVNALGAADIHQDFPEWAWGLMSSTNGVFGLPWGAGPTSLYYREDVLADAGISVPTTWAAFAEASAAFKSKRPDANFTQLVTSTGPWLNGLFWQAGSRPFNVSGTDIKISINDEAARKVCEYWQGMLDAKLVDTQPASTQEWYATLDNGSLATYIGAAWNMRRMGANAKAGLGKWRVALLPFWEEGKPVSANIGGSGTVIFAPSSKQEAAYEFIKFFTHDPEASGILMRSGLFPVLRQNLDDAALMDEPLPFLGGQAGRRVFAESMELIPEGYQWSPFQGFVQGEFEEKFPVAAAGQSTMLESLDAVQKAVVDYASVQGFTVS
jgi:multiple sugar transport system substrate-binding protein